MLNGKCLWDQQHQLHLGTQISHLGTQLSLSVTTTMTLGVGSGRLCKPSGSRDIWDTVRPQGRLGVSNSDVREGNARPDVTCSFPHSANKYIPVTTQSER